MAICILINMLMAQLVLVSVMMVVPCTLEAAAARPPKSPQGRPPQSVDAGGSGRQTVSPAAAAHHTTTSLSLPRALLWCRAATNIQQQPKPTSVPASAAPGEPLAFQTPAVNSTTALLRRVKQ